MEELIPYIFEHPQYGKLRVVMEEGRIYYDLFDVKKIFVKTAQQLYETIADSEGELKNFNVVMKPAKKNLHNLFYSDDVMGVETANRKKNVAADFNFCDEKVIADLMYADYATEKLAAKWVLGFVKKNLKDPTMSFIHEAQGVAMISDNTILEPINIYMDVNDKLIINDQIFE